MRKITIRLPAALLIIISLAVSCGIEPDTENSLLVPVEGAAGETAAAYIPGDLIVKVAQTVPAAEIDLLVPGVRVKTIASLGGADYLLYGLSADQEIDTVQAALMTSGKVLYAEKNAVYELCAYVPNDPLYAQYQYSPRITQCDLAWEIEQGSEDVIVAVLDTGVNGTHEELAGRVTAGRDIIAGEDLPAGVNSDYQGHGSHVAGIIAAKGDNGRGIAGVAWGVKIMPVKIFAQDSFTTAAHISAGIVWAIEHGANVLNLSLSGSLFSMAVCDTVQYAHQQGVVMVAAIGNDSIATIKYPAALPGVIAVGASNGRDEVVFFSTQGRHLSVVAPGESIYSLVHDSNTEYMYRSGTSMATPFVSGMAALLLSHNPGLSPAEIRSMIEDSAEPLGTEDFTPEYGHGRVNVYQALTIPVRNNYQSITVNVSNRGQPVGGVKILIEDTADSTIIQSGLTSYGAATGGSPGRIVFNHLRFGTYKVRAHVGEAMVSEVALSPTGEPGLVSFDFDTSLVLVVNGIKDSDTSFLTDEFLYARKLTALGKYYTIWKTYFYGPPSAELIAGYDIVIWYTGKTRGNPETGLEVLNSQERTVIRNFLAGGGRLYLCGNNLAEDLAVVDPGFLATCLHAEYAGPRILHDELAGAGFLADMDVLLYPEDDDEIIPAAGAEGILDASDDLAIREWAGISWDAGCRLVFTTVCPNEVVYCTPDSFLEDIIGWLDEDL